MSYAIGDRFWIADDENAWLVATLKSASSTVLEFSTEKGLRKIKVSEIKTKLEPCGSHIDDDVENLVDLDELSEGAILHHTRLRFQKKLIYTHVGSILVAVNPFENLNIYSDRDIRRAMDSSQPYPHVFVTAATAYLQLKNNLKNQAVLISGESGAGKTETTKKVLSFLANIAPDLRAKASLSEPGMEDKILQSNPLLEALGNAKTLRNNNSSRFGKWMKVGLNQNFLIQGCEIVNYLLEKSRVVTQSTMERNYHVFYQLIAGADSSMKKRLHLTAPSDFHYLNQSGCSKIEGVDDAADFREVLQAMNTLQFNSSTIESMLKVIAGILLLGNISFEEGRDSESSKVSSAATTALKHCAELLGINIESFTYALVEKKVQMGRGSIVSIALSVAQAEENKDTIAKTLYSNLFDWTIQKVNTTLKSPSAAPYSIGILDIFGFEVFELNSFEQLCINYANEKLQFHFNEVIFKEETLMYESEGVPTEHVVFEDNAECVKLIEGKPYGLLSLLDEECSLGNATDLSYISKIDKTFGANKSNNTNKFYMKNKTKPDCFSVIHFAGAVEYNILNFLDKNRDTLSITAKEVLESSNIPLITELFHISEYTNTNTSSNTTTTTTTTGKVNNSNKNSTKSTLGGQFRNQLIGLLQTLYTTEPHFIRCIKPNHAKKPNLFDGMLALRQLRYAGLFEAIRIRKSGYAYRSNFKQFANIYSILINNNTSSSDKEKCTEIIEYLKKNNIFEPNTYYIGTTKIFLKTNQQRSVLDRLKTTIVTVYAIKIQHIFQIFIAKIKLNKLKYAKIKERNRILYENNIKSAAAIVIQKYIRRKLVLIMMVNMHSLIELRKVLFKKEISKVKECLERIDVQNKRATSKTLIGMFQHEVKIARVMVRLLEIQAKLREDLAIVIDAQDSAGLDKLILKAEKLEMGSDEIVLKAKELLLRLHTKKTIMSSMVAFLKSEEEYTDTILATLHAAEEYDIDPEFIHRVRTVYDKAGPRLKSRNRLRHMIESVDRYGIEQSCLEVMAIQRQQPGFGESELRAAKAMLRLLDFDAELSVSAECGPEGGDQEDEGDTADETTRTPCEAILWGRPVLSIPTYPKLGREVRTVCAAIVSARNPATLSTEKRRLLEIAGSVERLYDIIRYYKWSHTLCTWRYPEVLLAQEQAKARHMQGFGALDTSEALLNTTADASSTNTTFEGEFYGLRPAEARSSAYIIRTLHKDFDPVSGSSSALMQAALGSVDLPTGVAEALSSLEMLSSIDAHPVLPNGQKFQKTSLKHPRTQQKDAMFVPGSSRSSSSNNNNATTSRTRTMNNVSTSGGLNTTSMNKKTGSHPTNTIAVRTTMIAPRTRETMKGATVFENIRKQTATDKQLQFTRANKEKWAAEADRHMDLVKKAAVKTGWK